MEKLKLGIAGSVGHAEKFVNLINSYEESEVIVYCAQDAESRDIAERLHLAYEDDFQTMLDKYDLDGVIITVPNKQKKDMVIAAAKAHVSIFLEKPLTVTSADARVMQDAVHEAGVKFYLSDPFIRPGILQLKHMMQDGVFGEVIGANIRHAGSRALDTPPLPHIYVRELSGGGIMADVGAHALHILHYLFGQPEALCSTCRCYTEPALKDNIEENASALLRYQDGKTVTVEASWISGGESSNHTIVYGTKAWAEVIDLPGKEGAQQLTLHTANGTKVYSPEDLPSMPTRHVRYFVEMMLHDLPNDIIGTVDESNCGMSIDDAAEVVRIIEAWYRSADKGFVEI